MPDFVNLIAPWSERNRTRQCHSGVGWGLGFIKGRKMYNTCDLQGFARRDKFLCGLFVAIQLLTSAMAQSLRIPQKKLDSKASCCEESLQNQGKGGID